MFDYLHKKFEKKDTDLCKLQEEEGFSRYILVRSLDNDHIKKLLSRINKTKTKNNKAELLYKELFESEISNDAIIDFIKDEYPLVREKRKEQEVYLPEIIKDFGEVRCGVRNDNLNDAVKDLVRDKSIKNKQQLEEKVDSLFFERIKGYILWQYYNQVTNDLIEHIFNDHPNVIPTLRKIKYVDFMVKKGAMIVPFDLKITHISDEFFDLFSKELIEACNGYDDFEVGDSKSEIDIIKQHYKGFKKELGLPNLGGLKKVEIMDILKKLNHEPTKHFIAELRKNRKKMIKKLSENLKPLEWWNYKFQGERLFKNNNRFFVFLAYESSFDDARPLKGELGLISEKVNTKLDNINDAFFNEINYYYEKDKGLEGAYKAISTSVLIVKNKAV